MSEFKFNIGEKEPDEKQIDRHKDFKKLLYNYEEVTRPLHKSPLYFYKNRRLWFIILIILLLLVVILSEVNGQ